MLGKLYLLRNFNNYFNRRIIKYSTLSEYLPTGDDGYFVIGDTNGTNFNPNDGVTTEHVIGSAGLPYDKDWNPDYCLYVEQGNIVSRWFVTKVERLRDKQYKIRLKRDSVADYYGNAIMSPCFIERGTLKEDDPLIVNSENVSFNKIKKQEYYLKDETKVPWVVCYLNQHERPFKTITAEYSSPEVLEINNCPELIALFGEQIKTATADQNIHHKVFNDNAFSFYYRYHFAENAFPIVHNRRFQVNCKVSPTSASANLGQMWEPAPQGEWDFCGNICDITGPWGYTDDGWTKMGGGNSCRPMRDVAADAVNNFKSNFNDRVSAVYSAMGCTHHSTGYTLPDIKKYQGKMIRCNNGKHFIFRYEDHGTSPWSTEGSTLRPKLLECFQAVDHNRWGLFEASPVSGFHVGVNASCTVDMNFKMSATVGVSVKLDLLGTKQEEGHDKAFQTHLIPYDIICFPAFNTTITNTDGNKISINGNAGINISRAISEQLGTDELYDIQLLPYCPCRELIGTDGDLDLRKIGVRQALPVKTTDTAQTIVTYCFFATSSFQYLEIDKLGSGVYETTNANVSDILAITNRKVQAECDMYRLSSPNYASQFEFNLAKCVPITYTGFAMDKFKVDICFRPHNPYIHIAPNFAFLYGGDFNDSRGLICSGDFGLTTMRNAWTDYQIRNKNYQNIFDRETRNLELHNKVAMGKDITQAIMGTLAGAAMGAMAGKEIGGIWGKAFGVGGTVGAGIGGTLAAGAGVADVVLNQMERKEDMAARHDIHELQLDNIRALPNSITHSAALTNNFKFFPILEFYTCTPQERTAFENYLEFYGMNVGRIGNIYEFMNTSKLQFVKGKMIRLELLSDNSFIANDIYDEISKGIYI